MSTRTDWRPGNEFLCVISSLWERHTGRKPRSYSSSLSLRVLEKLRSRLSRLGRFIAHAGREDRRARSAASIELSGARGETVDSQVVVQSPARGLTNVNLSVSALTGRMASRSRRRMSRSIATLFNRDWHRQYGGGQQSTARFWNVPEPLIPFTDPETGLPCAQVRHFKGLQR